MRGCGTYVLWCAISLTPPPPTIRDPRQDKFGHNQTRSSSWPDAPTEIWQDGVLQSLPVSAGIPLLLDSLSILCRVTHVALPLSNKFNAASTVFDVTCTGAANTGAVSMDTTAVNKCFVRDSRRKLELRAHTNVDVAHNVKLLLYLPLGSQGRTLLQCHLERGRKLQSAFRVSFQEDAMFTYENKQAQTHANIKSTIVRISV